MINYKPGGHMRTTSAAASAVLLCLAGAFVSGCTEASDEPKEESAQQILDRANDTMSALTSVTSEARTEPADGEAYSSHDTTDLKSRCTHRITWDGRGTLEQIRIGDTDYVRPSRAYLDAWSGSRTAGAAEQKRWLKVPADRAQPGDGLAVCRHEFTSFGVATKGGRAEVDGTPALALKVTDKTVKEGSYTFYVAAEGKPYILKVVYAGTDFHTTTTYSAFDEPLDIRPPADADVLDGTSR
jgi:hypothetical protein